MENRPGGRMGTKMGPSPVVRSGGGFVSVILMVAVLPNNTFMHSLVWIV